MIKINLATENQIPALVPLFNSYRIFYQQESNEEACNTFLKERLSKQESIIFIAYENDIAIGFTQLYKTFSSVTLQPYYILNDLYVSDTHRQKGIATIILNKAKDFCIEKQYKGLQLETDVDNPAQKLYEKLGWKRNTDTFHYFWFAPK
ncbi:MAG: GNAT family N-acetyltransferase [Cellulophaga sp.]